MRRNPDFILREIADESYILPLGQAMSDHKRGVKTNETGIFLWNHLSEDITELELLDKLSAYYEADKESLPLLKKDLHNFLLMLHSHGMLLLKEKEPSPDETCSQCLSIAGLTIKLFGPAEAFSDHFSSFITKSEDFGQKSPDQNVIILAGLPDLNRGGTLILRNKELIIIEQDDRYLLLFPSSKGIFEMHLKKNGSLATLYVKPPFDEELREDIFHALRFAFLTLASEHGMVALHSASVLYRDKAWLFSAKAQTGKTTHANLWNKNYQTPFINGDLNLITIKNGKALILGTPWCGTSALADPATYELGGILLLKQGPEDVLENLSPDKRILYVLQRLISPSFKEELFDRNIKLVEKIAGKIFIARLFCTPTDHAAEVAKEAVDAYLDQLL